MTPGIKNPVTSTVDLDESEYLQLGRFCEEFNITIEEGLRAAVLQMLWQDGYVRRNRLMDADTRGQPPRQFLMKWGNGDDWGPMDWPPSTVNAFAHMRAVVNDTIPDGEIWAVSNGEVVGKIVGINTEEKGDAVTT